MSKIRIITVSREFGSGGRTVAKLIADKLGYTCYDSKLVERIAKESGFDEEFVRERGEYANASSSFLFALVTGSNGGLSVSDQIYIAQNNIIKELAEAEPCVIVGRCADYILRGRDDCLHTFFHADKEFRANHIVEKYGERSDSIDKRINDKDDRRKAYYKHYTGRNWGDVQNYHVSLDTSVLGFEQCAEIVANAVRNHK